MHSSKKLSLQARIHWRCLSWFKAVKWPSANEVDFGDFLVVFDFKKGSATKLFTDGSEQELVVFKPQKNTREVSAIVGEIECVNHTITLQQPLVDADGKVHLTLGVNSNEGDVDDAKQLQGDVRSSLCLGDDFTITPKIEDRDVYLDVEVAEKSQQLAIFVASLLVFQRFAF